MMKRKRKFGQMEIMGIAVIVLLISVGFMFFLKFSLTKDAKTVQKSFQKSVIPTYFIASILETSITPGDCDLEGNLKDLISDCVEWSGCLVDNNMKLPLLAGNIDREYGSYDGTSTNYDCRQCASGIEKFGTSSEYKYPPTSCGYIYEKIDTIMRTTLGEQGRKYIFSIENQNRDEIMRISSGDCTIGQSGSTEYKEFILANGEHITMTICD